MTVPIRRQQGHRPIVTPSYRIVESLLVAVMAGLIPLGFALYTDHVWEDYLITLRHSENLVDGNGLVYQAGERVHGFTSPLGTLLPAACYIVGGKGMPTLWLFRVFCVAAFSAGAVLLWRAMRDDPGNLLAAVVTVALYAFSAKGVDFTINGMETPFMLLFLVWGVYLFQTGPALHWLATGVCWAGLMWTRPDGCVYIAVLAAISFFFRPESWRELVTVMLKSAAVCAALYLPWFAWAWTYYGSPVPHTVTAKALHGGAGLTSLLGAMLDLLARFPALASHVFQPTYCAFDESGWLGPTWGWLMPRITNALGLFCGLYWLLPVNDRLGRATSLGFTLLVAYFVLSPSLFPWYLPPVELLGVITLARGVITLGRVVTSALPRDPLYGRLRPVAPAFLLALCAWQILLFALTTKQMRIQQVEIEVGVRADIGKWLKDRVRPGETIFLEPLGYIGYYSGAKMLDALGLVAPEVIQLVRDRSGLITGLKPDWLVLRPGEGGEAAAFIAEHYALVRHVDVKNRLNCYRFIPGRAYVEMDAVFNVYQKHERFLD